MPRHSRSDSHMGAEIAFYGKCPFLIIGWRLLMDGGAVRQGGIGGKRVFDGLDWVQGTPESDISWKSPTPPTRNPIP